MLEYCQDSFEGENESESDTRTYDEIHDYLCNTIYCRQYAAAVLQYCRYMDCRQVSRQQSAGCCWIVIHIDDIYYIYINRTLYGKRSGVFHKIRSA